MKEIIGKVFSIAGDNEPAPGCTISKEVAPGIVYFSLAAHSDISAEIHPYGKLLLVQQGILKITGQEPVMTVPAGYGVYIPAHRLVGMKAEVDTVYTEVQSKEEYTMMNEIVKAGEVFKLAELVPYRDGKIVNMDVLHNDKMKFVVMAFGAGTGLSEHAAPGDALIFALDGEAMIGYEGKQYPIKAGEQFHFAKGGLHAVTAEKNFKMALLLVLE